MYENETELHNNFIQRPYELNFRISSRYIPIMKYTYKQYDIIHVYITVHLNYKWVDFNEGR